MNTPNWAADTRDEYMSTRKNYLVPEHQNADDKDEDTGSENADTESEYEDTGSEMADTEGEYEDTDDGDYPVELEFQRKVPQTDVSVQEECEQLDWDRWNECSTFKEAQQLNNEFLMGRVSHNMFVHDVPRFLDSCTRRLMNRVFLIQIQPAYQYPQYRKEGVSMTRSKGQCAFMLPSEDSITFALQHFLLKHCQSLWTLTAELKEAIELRKEIPEYDSDPSSMVETRRADLWHKLEECMPMLEDENGHEYRLREAMILKYAIPLARKKYLGQLDEDLVVFLVTTKEYGQDIQASLLDVIDDVAQQVTSFIKKGGLRNATRLR